MNCYKLLQKISHTLRFSMVFFAGMLVTSALVPAEMPIEHQSLKVRNTFKKPEDVVSYYIARDASGFVWSGLLDIERQAYTTWKETPEHDSFYIARHYEVLPNVKIQNDKAVVEVRYQLTGIGDAHGTRLPPDQREKYVQFELVKVGSAWKINKPGPRDISPIVLENKFRYASL